MNGKIINLYENKNQLLNASIDKITVELINKKTDKSRGQIIVLSGCSPLAGTTSIAISLAIAMAATGRKTILVDCDVRKSEHYKKLSDDIQKGLADYIAMSGKSTVSANEVIYDTNIDNLQFIPCGASNNNPTRILCSEKLDELVGQLVSDNDCVIMDFPSFSVVPDSQIMYSKADGVIFIAALGETKKSQIKDTRRISAKLGEKYWGIIINKVKKDIFRANVKNSDYYLLDKNGKQKFETSKAYINRKKTEKRNKNGKKK